MPLALIFCPFRRSMVSSIRQTIVPLGINVMTKLVSSILLALRLDQTARFNTG